MINGAHVILYSTDADADREVLKTALGLTHVDAGHGWLIFGLPPSEAAVHPSDANDGRQLYFMTDDVDAEVRRLRDHGLACDEVATVGWGRVTAIHLPGGGRLGLYQPRHARP